MKGVNIDFFKNQMVDCQSELAQNKNRNNMDVIMAASSGSDRRDVSASAGRQTKALHKFDFVSELNLRRTDNEFITPAKTMNLDQSITDNAVTKKKPAPQAQTTTIAL